MTFGQVIADARKKLGLSQKELAARIKKEEGGAISPQYLNDIERDRRNPPSEFLIEQFAKELKLSREYLILAAGTLPEELKKILTGSDPQAVEKAFKVFRRQIKSP
jgi:transcriptional regulator with XRE-family HTH domain